MFSAFIKSERETAVQPIVHQSYLKCLRFFFLRGGIEVEGPPAESIVHYYTGDDNINKDCGF